MNSALNGNEGEITGHMMNNVSGVIDTHNNMFADGNNSVENNDNQMMVNSNLDLGKTDNISEGKEYSLSSSSENKAFEEKKEALVQAGTKDFDGNYSTLSTTNEGQSPSENWNDNKKSEDEESLNQQYPTVLKWQFHSSNPISSLPDTVTVLEAGQEGSKVFLVGTAHFSLESQEDVSKTIRAVQPDVVMIELCKSRVDLLSLDEQAILEETKNMNFQKIKTTIEQNGLLQGFLYLLLLTMSAHLTKELGMAPGGEFRRAFKEAKQIPGCLLHLGDRPINITLQRALATLSFWQKLKIAWGMLNFREPISKEEVERCKQKDLLEEMLAEMTGEFPEISTVFVKERDIYLTYSLQKAASSVPSRHHPECNSPTYVVGVVGIGHVPGIRENWGKIVEEDIPPILRVPEPSKSRKIIRRMLRLSLIGLGAYGAYNVLSRTSFVKKALVLLPFNC